MKITSNSNGYGIRRLPASGTMLASIKQRTGDLERQIAIAYFFGATIFAGNDRRVVDDDRPACD
jgi:hypothetical protein